MKTKIVALVLLIFTLCSTCMLTGCGALRLKDFGDSTVGVITDTSYDKRFEGNFDNANIRYYDSHETLYAALSSGEVDCILWDVAIRDGFRRNEQRLYSTEMSESDVAFAFKKSEEASALETELSAFIDAMRADGRLASLESDWRAQALPSDPSITIPAADEGKTTLKVAIDTSAKPFVYKSGDAYVGMEIELLALFCEETGYGLELVEATAEAALAGVSSGEYDLAAGGISATAARKESHNFTAAHTELKAVASYFVSGFRAIWDGGVMTRLTVDSVGAVMAVFALAILISAMIGYFLGSINSAIIISRVLYRDDVRRHGSGNAGMTNMLRTYGMGAAGLTLLGDVLKTVISVFCASMLCGAGLGGYIAGTFCICGHIFPIYYKFKGGKGVLCAATMIAMLSPLVFLICFSFFLIIVLCTRYVSLGSVIASATYPLLLLRLYGNGVGNVFAVIVAVLIIICHRKNLGRLWRGEESKISFKRKGSANAEIKNGEDK